MSRRKCIPSKRISSIAPYARARAAVRSAPYAVTPSTRPPAVTTGPSPSRRVPAWNTTRSSLAGGSPLIASPLPLNAAQRQLSDYLVEAIGLPGH